MESISVKILNELFSKTTKNKYKINEKRGHIGIPENEDEGNQGEYNEKFIYYRHPEMSENLFMEETYHTDSYNSDNHLVEIKFVKGKEKTIIIYEPIN